jgi:hypothetical protein
MYEASPFGLISARFLVEGYRGRSNTRFLRLVWRAGARARGEVKEPRHGTVEYR